MNGRCGKHPADCDDPHCSTHRLPEPAAVQARAEANWNAARARLNLDPAPFPASRTDFTNAAYYELLGERGTPDPPRWPADVPVLPRRISRKV